MAKSIKSLIDFAAKLIVWQRMMQRIIRPMLITRMIWQNSRAVLLRRKAAQRKALAFRQHISIISDRRGNCKEKYSCVFIYNLQLNLYKRIDKNCGWVYDTDMRKERPAPGGKPLSHSMSTGDFPGGGSGGGEGGRAVLVPAGSLSPGLSAGIFPGGEAGTADRKERP